jgi:hypothetical protein
MTAPELKGWLYRYISACAGEHQDYAGQVPGDRHYPDSAAALDRLAEHVQNLPDDDERFARLAAASPERVSFADIPVGGNLGTRCAGFGPGLWCGDDPDQWVSDYVESEVGMLRMLYRQ